MKIHNCLPTLIHCLNRWEHCPSERTFDKEYAEPLRAIVGDFFNGFHEVLRDLDWKTYREKAIQLSPEAEEARFKKNLALVENLFQFKLEGEVFLLGTFETMDGFARFDRGQHKVYLGLDESHLNGRYIDILTTHELTHVARESRNEVWEGFGLNPKMKRSAFLETQPVIEHLMGEGFSCAVSELLIPGEPAWSYVYQNEQSLQKIYREPAPIERAIKKEIKHPDGDYGKLYQIEPDYAHYVWASEWVKQVLNDHAGQDPRKLVNRCSKNLSDHALSFTLERNFE